MRGAGGVDEIGDYATNHKECDEVGRVLAWGWRWLKCLSRLRRGNWCRSGRCSCIGGRRRVGRGRWCGLWLRCGWFVRFGSRVSPAKCVETLSGKQYRPVRGSKKVGSRFTPQFVLFHEEIIEGRSTNPQVGVSSYSLVLPFQFGRLWVCRKTERQSKDGSENGFHGK